jgi:hypothetical protein
MPDTGHFDVIDRRSYSIAYDAERHVYRLTFSDLKAWKTGAIKHRAD